MNIIAIVELGFMANLKNALNFSNSKQEGKILPSLSILSINVYICSMDYLYLAIALTWIVVLIFVLPNKNIERLRKNIIIAVSIAFIIRGIISLIRLVSIHLDS